jgi:hypothetical protein
MRKAFSMLNKKRNSKRNFKLKNNTNSINPLNAELTPMCHLLILLGDLTFMGKCIVSISNKMQHYTVYLYLETTLHVSGGTVLLPSCVYPIAVKYIVSYHISYHILSCLISYIILYCIVSYHTISYAISYHTISCHIISYHIMSHISNRTVSTTAVILIKWEHFQCLKDTIFLVWNSKLPTKWVINYRIDLCHSSNRDW